MELHNHLPFHKISALQRRHAKKAMIPMLFQWLERSYSSPGTPKSVFLENIGFKPQFFGIFMKFSEI